MWFRTDKMAPYFYIFYFVHFDTLLHSADNTTGTKFVSGLSLSKIQRVHIGKKQWLGIMAQWSPTFLALWTSSGGGGGVEGWSHPYAYHLCKWWFAGSHTAPAAWFPPHCSSVPGHGPGVEDSCYSMHLVYKSCNIQFSELESDAKNLNVLTLQTWAVNIDR